MTRENARELAVHLIYAHTFTDAEPEELVATRLEREYFKKLAEENEVYAERPTGKQVAYIDGVVSGVANRRDELENLIGKHAIDWDVGRMSRLVRSVLLLAIYEILWVEEVPTNVSIAEAVRIAKKYDGDDTGAFVNGILGAFARSLENEEVQ